MGAIGTIAIAGFCVDFVVLLAESIDVFGGVALAGLGVLLVAFFAFLASLAELVLLDPGLFLLVAFILAFVSLFVGLVFCVLSAVSLASAHDDSGDCCQKESFVHFKNLL